MLNREQYTLLDLVVKTLNKNGECVIADALQEWMLRDAAIKTNMAERAAEHGGYGGGRPPTVPFIIEAAGHGTVEVLGSGAAVEFVNNFFEQNKSKRRLTGNALSVSLTRKKSWWAVIDGPNGEVGITVWRKADKEAEKTKKRSR